MNSDQHWRAVLGELELQMSQASFDTWLRDSRLVAFEDNVFIVGVDSGFIKDWLDTRLRVTVERTLVGIVGRKTSVSFVVWPESGEAIDTPNKPILPDVIASKNKNQQAALKEHLCSLDNFVVGPENRLAHAASKAVSEKFDPAQSPLFLYGDVGLGKTHLLSGIKNACEEQGLNVQMLAAENFTNELVFSIRSGGAEMFREKYRSCDVLLVDDIQFFVGKKSSSEELLHTIDQMHSSNLQVVLTSNISLDSLIPLGRRLCSRIEAGLVVQITRPSYKTRKKIVWSKASTRGLDVTEDVVVYLAENIRSSVRALEGAVNHLDARSRLLGQPASLSSASAATRQAVGPMSSSTSATSDHIIKIVASEFKVTSGELRGKSRARRFTAPRQLAMLLLKDTVGCSLSEIGALMGGRDHTTARYGCSKARELLSCDDIFKSRADDIRKIINKH